MRFERLCKRAGVERKYGVGFYIVRHTCADIRGTNPRYDFSILSPKNWLPFRSNPHFLGRRRELLDTYLSLMGGLNPLGSRVVGVQGMGGVGKTQLVSEFVRRFGFAFSAVLWIDASEADEWLYRVADAARD